MAEKQNKSGPIHLIVSYLHVLLGTLPYGWKNFIKGISISHLSSIPYYLYHIFAFENFIIFLLQDVLIRY